MKKENKEIKETPVTIKEFKEYLEKYESIGVILDDNTFQHISLTKELENKDKQYIYLTLMITSSGVSRFYYIKANMKLNTYVADIIDSLNFTETPIYDYDKVNRNLIIILDNDIILTRSSPDLLDTTSEERGNKIKDFTLIASDVLINAIQKMKLEIVARGKDSFYDYIKSYQGTPITIQSGIYFDDNRYIATVYPTIHPLDRMFFLNIYLIDTSNSKFSSWTLRILRRLTDEEMEQEFYNREKIVTFEHYTIFNDNNKNKNDIVIYETNNHDKNELKDFKLIKWHSAIILNKVYKQIVDKTFEGVKLNENI